MKHALLILLYREGGHTCWPLVRVLDDQKSLRPMKVGRGIPKTLILVWVQQTVCLICHWGTKWLFVLSCLPAYVFLRGGCIPDLGKRKQRIEVGDFYKNHSCKRCCTLAELIMTNMSDNWVSGWFLGAFFTAFCSDMWFPWWQDGSLVDSSFGATGLALTLTGSDSFDWNEKICGPFWLSRIKPSLLEWVCFKRLC